MRTESKSAGTEPEKLRETPHTESLRPERKLRPEQERALNEAMTTLQSQIPLLSDREKRSGISMLNPAEPIRAVCRFTSDWFVAQHDNLAILWRYLKDHETGLPQEIQKRLQEVVDLGKPLGPADVRALESLIDAKVNEPAQRAKCGFLLSFVSDATKTKGQELGAQIIVEALKQITADVAAAGEDSGKLSVLLPVVDAATAAVASARQAR